ncbi:MAG TPA: hypothetical protein VGP36_10970 [Mycobacteriales bacterium]|jgi:hypothetical protein|nr:hypothetical protein [Mycobacteriales bacterium]
MPAYCRAYLLSELRSFPGFPAGGRPEDAVVYVWDDLSVVDSPVSATPTVLWSGAGTDWREFCEKELGFAVPADLVGDDRAAG